MKNNRLINESTLGTAKVIVDILPKGRCIPNRKLQSISKITIHNTGGYAPAKNNHTYMGNNNKPSGKNAKASWHFTVDDKEIYQAQSTDYEMWHAGDSKGNKNSIGIEICQSKDPKIQEKIYKNSIALVKELLKYHNLKVTDVVQHNYWSGKNCPELLRSNTYGYSWDWFIGEIKKEDKPVQYGVDIAEFTTKEKAKEFSNTLKEKENAHNTIYQRANGNWGIKVFPYGKKESAENFKKKLKDKYNAYSEVYSF